MRYREMKPGGAVVPAEDAFDYAKAHLDEVPEEDKQDFVEWFFSGPWICEQEEDDDAAE